MQGGGGFQIFIYLYIIYNITNNNNIMQKWNKYGMQFRKNQTTNKYNNISTATDSAKSRAVSSVEKNAYWG